jgi:hypothetical protein
MYNALTSLKLKLVNETNLVVYDVFYTVISSWTTLVYKSQLLDLRLVETNTSFNTTFYFQTLTKLNGQLLSCPSDPYLFAIGMSNRGFIVWSKVSFCQSASHILSS